jgi:hypothetical protein
MYFEQKFEFFQNPLKLIYETIMYNQSAVWGQDQEILSFVQFFPQTADFR